MIIFAHLEAFLKALRTGDANAARAHLADTVTLRSPILTEPFVGKKAVAEVLVRLFGIVDAFEPKLLLRDGADAVAVLTLTVGEHDIDAFDHIHLDADGRIGSMTVAWRPLPAVVEVQQRLVPALGGQALQLVPLDKSGDR